MKHRLIAEDGEGLQDATLTFPYFLSYTPLIAIYKKSITIIQPETLKVKNE